MTDSDFCQTAKRITKYARRAFLRQFFAALTCLLVGVAMIRTMTVLANAHYHLLPGDWFTFDVFAWMFNGLGLVVIVGGITFVSHFDQAPPRDTFIVTLEVTLVGAVVLLVLQAGLSLLMRLKSAQDFKLSLISLGLSFILFALTGASTGIIQGIFLLITHFNAAEHQYLTHRRRNIEVCLGQRLPYSFYIETCWTTVFWGMVTTAGIAILRLGVSPPQADTSSDGIPLLITAFGVAMAGVGVTRLMTLINILCKPVVHSVQGQVSKRELTHATHRLTTYKVYKLSCCGVEMETTLYTWSSIQTEFPYRLWYYRPGTNILVACRREPTKEQKTGLGTCAATRTPGQSQPANTTLRPHDQDPPRISSKFPVRSKTILISEISYTPPRRWKQDLKAIGLCLGCVGQMLLYVFGAAMALILLGGILDIWSKSCPGLTTILSIIGMIALVAWRVQRIKRISDPD